MTKPNELDPFLPLALKLRVAPSQTVLPGRVSGLGEALRAPLRPAAVLPDHREAARSPAHGAPGRRLSPPGAPGEASRHAALCAGSAASERGSGLVGELVLRCGSRNTPGQ